MGSAIDTGTVDDPVVNECDLTRVEDEINGGPRLSLLAVPLRLLLREKSTVVGGIDDT